MDTHGHEWTLMDNATDWLHAVSLSIIVHSSPFVVVYECARSQFCATFVTHVLDLLNNILVIFSFDLKIE